jgi:hypothetical protein
VRSRRTVPREHVSSGHNPSTYQSPSLPASLISNELENYIFYSKKFLRRDGAVDLALREVQLSDIIMAETTTSNKQMFHQAFLSFALITFGSQHRQTQVIDRGYVIYGVVVKHLNQALSDSDRRTSDEVFLSVVTLALLECFVPTGPKQYIKHMIALERILELRNPSPSSYCSPKLSEFYKSVRHMILFASLHTGKASILARPQWKAFLRAQCSEEQLVEQDLFDVLADCTVLIVDRDKTTVNWGSDLNSNTHERDEIKQRATNSLSHLRAWKERWNRDERNSYSETPIIEEASRIERSPFLTTFEFSNPSSAAMFMFYNTTLIYVLRVLASLPILPEPPGQNSDQDVQDTLQNAGHLENFETLGRDQYLSAERLAALEVCRGVPFDLTQRSRLGVCVSPLSHWAFTTAWTTLGGIESPEGRWMMELLNTSSLEGIAKGIWDK